MKKCRITLTQRFLKQNRERTGEINDCITGVINLTFPDNVIETEISKPGSYTFTIQDAGTQDNDSLRAIVQSALSDKFSEFNSDDLLVVMLIPIKDPVPTPAPKPAVESVSAAASSGGEQSSNVENRPKTEPPLAASEETQKIYEQIMDLTGGEPFKKLAKEILTVAPRLIEEKAERLFTSQSFLFALNAGCGFATYLKHLAELLSATQLFPLSKDSVIRINLDPGKEILEKEMLEQTKAALQRRSKWSSIVAIDISYWINRLHESSMREFLYFLSGLGENNIYCFRTPFIEKDMLKRVEQELGDIFFLLTLSFPPFNRAELESYTRKRLEEDGFTIDEKAMELFGVRLQEERSDGRFYGLETVNKVLDELLYQYYLSTVDSEDSEKHITESLVSRLVASDQLVEREEGLAALDRMIGMGKIKEQIEQIAAQIQLSRDNPQLDFPSLHMRFVGAPGTGKTTVARIIGRYFKELGLLRNGDFFEISGRDLCGRYIGETAPKTASICRDAYGSVLFIDEAYSLYTGDDSGRDFGREALTTLISEMENHRHDMLVIMAGYSEDMEILMQGNRGLESRMPYKIVFENYSAEELYQIFMSMVRKNFAYEEEFDAAAREYFESIPTEVLESRGFSNGRFVRNLFERVWGKAALRMQLRKSPELILTTEDLQGAKNEQVFAELQKKTGRKIGFGNQL
ncbi:MAG: AAA family ATPase [Clostridiaceae bacterium]|nr:AAA family ATPase [Clostridiaceae bacterium]